MTHVLALLLICDKNAQMNVFFVSFNDATVNILDEIANANY
jgi:hypothetical protein